MGQFGKLGLLDTDLPVCRGLLTSNVTPNLNRGGG